LFAKIKQQARHLKSEVFTLYFAARDNRTPWYAKLIVAAIVAYALSPIDLIPDFLPVIGYLDDLVLIPIGIALAIKLIPHSVLIDCRARALKAMENKKPVSWVAGAVIILIWLGITMLCAIWVYNQFATH
jgi:uncharacterized membrane protein YkvA (DUF1232 family)